MLLCITISYSQASFNTGTMEVYVGKYGKILLYDPEGTVHLQRASILVGTSPTAVFDYQNDQEELEPTVLIDDPAISDYEIYGAYDNSFSSLPPDVIIKTNVYGWNNGSYTIVKFNVKNDEASTINALIGLDIIPQLNGEYGFDSVTYIGAEGVIRFHRGAQMNMGIKLLSASLSSLYSFEWYEDYYVDSDYWTWMNYGSLQPLYASGTADGPVTITSQDAEAIDPGASFDVYYALALGNNEETILANIDAAVDRYNSWFISVEENDLYSNECNLRQNFPNPFACSTSISYHLPDNGYVSLKVYDVIGNEVATLVNSEQTGGSHSIEFDATGLKSGVYYYTLRFDDHVKTRRMLLKN
jgi:hypothetical protein